MRLYYKIIWQVVVSGAEHAIVGQEMETPLRAHLSARAISR